MKTRYFLLQVAGFLLCTLPGAAAQAPCTETAPEADSTGIRNLGQKLHFTGGQITLPFKIRPKADTESFRLTTDVTLGGYIGLKYQLSEKRNYSLTLPLSAGLTFINLNNGNTTLDRTLDDAEVVPGLTWATGIILQLDQYNIGLMFGKDYASEIGNQWQYHGKTWWSFGIGFSFLQ